MARWHRRWGGVRERRDDSLLCVAALIRPLSVCLLCCRYHSKGWFFGLLAGFIIAAYKFKAAVDENKVEQKNRTEQSKRDGGGQVNT